MNPAEVFEEFDGPLALTDECSLAGVVRAHIAAKQQQLQLIVGSEFRLHRLKQK